MARSSKAEKIEPPLEAKPEPKAAPKAKMKGRRGRPKAPARSAPWFILLGLYWIALGVVAMAVPLVAAPPADLFFCALLSIAGTGLVVFPLRERYGSASLTEVASGAIFIGTGTALIVMRPEDTVLLTLILAAFFAAESIVKLTFALQLHGRGERAWALFAALLTAGLAAMTWFRWPSAALWVLGLQVGLYLAMNGWGFTALGLATRRMRRRRRRRAS
jgi:uncharacterized membrane protein HdeD (DUF308 family)